ncbi:hypothetical protein PYV61_20185, partial [Roseisolibacter sp. H3M3-2]
VVAAAAMAAVSAAAPAAGAQPIPRPRAAARSAEPSVWASASAGLFQAESIRDGRTNARWDFGNAIQYRATLETVVAPSTTVGVQGTWAPAVPTVVSTLGLADAPATACAGSCQGSADLMSLTALGRLGGGRGLHQVIELAAGVQQVRRLRRDGGEALLPARDTDLHASAAYGIGFGLSPRAAVALVQEFGIVSHQRDFLPGGTSALTQQRVTRLTVRIGSGGRR